MLYRCAFPFLPSLTPSRAKYSKVFLNKLLLEFADQTPSVIKSFGLWINFWAATYKGVIREVGRGVYVVKIYPVAKLGRALQKGVVKVRALAVKKVWWRFSVKSEDIFIFEYVNDKKAVILTWFAWVSN